MRDMRIQIPRQGDATNNAFIALASLIDYARLQKLCGAWYFRIDFTNGGIRKLAIDDRKQTIAEAAQAS